MRTYYAYLENFTDCRDDDMQAVRAHTKTKAAEMVRQWLGYGRARRYGLREVVTKTELRRRYPEWAGLMERSVPARELDAGKS